MSGEDRLTAMVKAGDLGVTKAEYLLEKFRNFFDVAAMWEEKAKGIVVTDASQTELMEQARKGRLFLKDRRVELEKERRRLKENALREGQTIDGIANTLKGLILPLEEYLDRQEHFVEYKAKEEADRKRVEEERLAEVERKRKEKEEREEAERVRAENAKLRREAEARERAVELERAAARREKEEAERKVREAERREREMAREKMEAEEARARVEEELAINIAKSETAQEVEEDDSEDGDEGVVAALLASEVKCPHCGRTFLLEDAG